MAKISEAELSAILERRKNWNANAKSNSPLATTLPVIHVEKTPKKNTHTNAKSIIIDGIHFKSQLEGRYYEHLKFLRDITKEVIRFHRQPLFDLPGGTRYTADFLVFYANGTVEYVDTKGRMFEASKRAIKQTEALYNIKIKIVRAGDFEIRSN